MAERILVVGASGFVGRHFSRVASEAGHEVSPTGRRPVEGWLECDLLEPGDADRAVADVSPTVVVNLSGASSVGGSWRDPVDTMRVNALGVVNLLRAVEANAPSAHVLCVSSGEVYGAPEEGGLPLTEDAPVRPLNPYGASKAAMEIVCGQMARSAGLRVAVIRAFNHLGPGQSDTFIAPGFAKQIVQAERRGDRQVALRVGNLSPARDFSDVRDIVDAYLRTIDRGIEGIYNVCSGRAMPLRDLVELMRAATPLEIQTVTEEERLRPNEAPVLYGSYDRLREATGWKPARPLDGTIAELLDWWRDRLGAEENVGGAGRG